MPKKISLAQLREERAKLLKEKKKILRQRKEILQARKLKAQIRALNAELDKSVLGKLRRKGRTILKDPENRRRAKIAAMKVKKALIRFSK